MHAKRAPRTPRTAGRISGFGCRRRAGARLLLAGDNTFEDGLIVFHFEAFVYKSIIFYIPGSHCVLTPPPLDFCVQ